MNNLHVILDIDQTMIDSMPFYTYLKNADKLPKPDCIENDHAIFMRPGLPEFLKYLDKNVKYISIWTNGSDGWLNHVLNNIITKYIPRKRFHILSSIQNSTPTIIDGNKYIIKDISKILKKYPHKDISLKNTIIIDDNFQNCNFNKYNSIPIKKFIALENNKKFNHLDNVKEIIDTIKNTNDVQQTLKNVYNGISDYNKLFS